MNGFVHIGSMLSTPWVGWVMLALLLLAVLSEALQPGLISGVGVSLSSHTNRNYKPAPDNFFGQTAVTLFRIGTLGMALCLWIGEADGCQIETYGIALAWIVGMLLVKIIGTVLIDYTFQLRIAADGIGAHYGNIVTMLCLALYPAILVLLQIGNTMLNRWVIGVCGGLFMLAVVYKVLGLYLRQWRSIIYITLYILTLEVLPMVSLVVVTSQMKMHL